MATFTALTTLPDEDAARAMGTALEGVAPEPTGVGVFELEDGSGLWEVGAYFEGEPDTAALAILAAAFGAAEFVVSELPETDWVAHVRRELAPVEAGRFFVHGSHDADRVPDGRIGLLIDAAMAFGTGHHGTTLGCLKALDALADAGVTPANVADIGCGTAVLAMAAAHTWNVPVLAADIDPVAVDVAEANIAANGLKGRVDCYVAAGFAHDEIQARGPYDLVFANILKGPLIALAPDIARMTATGGYVILSGLLNAQAAEITSVYTREGFNLVSHTEIVDWSTLILNRSAI